MLDRARKIELKKTVLACQVTDFCYVDFKTCVLEGLCSGGE